MISREARDRIVAMRDRGYTASQIARSLNVSNRTVYFWLRRDDAGEGTATKERVWPYAPQINTTEAGYAVAGMDGWFSPAEVGRVTGASDVTALLKKMLRLGAVERKGKGKIIRYKSLVLPREWLEKRKVWWLALLDD